MKKSAEMKALPIISISDGSEIGRVKSLVINPEKGSVDFLTIEHEDWQVSVKAIPFKKVVGIGEYAVTVENENAVIDLNEIPIANQLVNKKIKINDTRVMTRKGQMIGNIQEFYVDDETGAIVSLELNAQDNTFFLGTEHVLTFGKDIIIVNEDAAEYFKGSFDQLVSHEPVFEAETEILPTQQHGLETIKTKQTQLLTGKSVIEDIYNLEGNLLIAKGSSLTEADIKAAQDAGPSVFVDLTMNIK
ncbi:MULTISPECIES: PRC-barrel domain-containing protein [Rossellomorea]|uniref:PRC-barrel domain-containing protein n=1 Tax=Rossellomorea TaxID=2837508 RepID=UPI0011E8E051|nr:MULTISPECIES: PRC-barrel domain-containing protein [Rossellomorea]MDT9025328.1 PRC-barrel domain-containing protein [Rossellomorea sp. YC4-1]TYS87814.1 photosystem reaction center subunit H [Rossellomorea aquimaris]